MKVAVLFDFLISRGGAEQFTWVLGKAFKADVYTAKFIKDKTCEEFEKLNVVSGEIKSFPRFGFTQMQAIKYFSNLKLDCDLIITSGDWAKHAALRNHPVLHYEHTPVRLLYDAYNEVKKQMPVFFRPVFGIWVNSIRKKDQLAVKNIDKIVCNSKNVRERIERFYGVKNTEIIHPPIMVYKFRAGKPRDYFLSVQRIGPLKRLEIQIEAFRRLPEEKLFIVGDAAVKPYYEKLLKSCPPNVKFLGQVDQQKLADLYSHCKAAIQTSKDEDFGRSPPEANASGKPCIAVNEGGFKETIKNRINGLLVDEPYTENLINAIKNLDNYRFNPNKLRKMSLAYSDKNFVRKMKKAAKEVMG